MITVAITTFNRGDIVEKAIRSALSFATMAGGRVVVVDDCSTDGTDSLVPRLFGEQVSSGLLTFARHDKNQGVTAAKNTAFELADAGWVIFLDSDDELITGASDAIRQCLLAHRDRPVVFFRCVNETGAFVGRRFDQSQDMPLTRYLAHTSYGEALVTVNKGIDQEPPFDADLRGYEGLGCAKLIKKHGPALLSDIVARRYNRSRRDRLSLPAGVLRRAPLLAIGHLRYITICGRNMSLYQRTALRIKAMIYRIIGRIYGLFRTVHD